MIEGASPLTVRGQCGIYTTLLLICDNCVESIVAYRAVPEPIFPMIWQAVSWTVKTVSSRRTHLGFAGGDRDDFATGLANVDRYLGMAGKAGNAAGIGAPHVGHGGSGRSGFLFWGLQAISKRGLAPLGANAGALQSIYCRRRSCDVRTPRGARARLTRTTPVEY
jgi:hypothetical protein